MKPPVEHWDRTNERYETINGEIVPHPIFCYTTLLCITILSPQYHCQNTLPPWPSLTSLADFFSPCTFRPRKRAENGRPLNSILWFLKATFLLWKLELAPAFTSVTYGVWPRVLPVSWFREGLEVTFLLWHPESELAPVFTTITDGARPGVATVLVSNVLC